MQFPDLGAVVGLAKGTWKIRAEDRLVLGPGFSISELVFEEARRFELSYAHSARVDHTIQ